MIGGKIAFIERTAESVWLSIQGTGTDAHATSNREICATNYELAVGDMVWWQSDRLFWIPQNGANRRTFFIRMRRSHPSGEPLPVTWHSL